MAPMLTGPSSGMLPVHSPHDGARVNLSYDRSARHPFIALVGVPDAELWSAWIGKNLWMVATNLLLVLGALAANFFGFARIVRGLAATSRDLHSVEARFREGIANMRDGFALWDRDDRLVVCNEVARGMYGLIADAIRPGAAFADLNRMLVRRVLADRSEAEIEATIAASLAAHRRADGERVQERLDGTVMAINEVPTGDGGIMSTYRDITAERRALRDLATSEAQFRDAIHSISEGFVLWSKDERLVIWNRRVLELLPHLDGVLEVGLSLEAFYDAAIDHARPDWPVARRTEWKAMRRACRSEFTRAELRVPSGLIVEALEQPLSDGGVVTIYRDVTAERRLVETLREREAQLIEALAAERETNAEQRRFVAIASHEFRTPLAIIDGATQRLEAKLAPVGEDVGNRLQRIRGAVARMTQIIERTLSSARLDGGRMEMNWQDMDLAQLVREVCERERQISARFTIVAGGIEAPLHIDGDPKLLEQVLANLLSNAVKYSGAARDICVDLRRDGDHAEIAVRDSGVGVPAEEIDQLFTRFYRARTAQGISGTGIGLHLVRELVTLHGGTVSVASTLGKGSTFTVRLPIARATRRRQAGGPRSACRCRAGPAGSISR
jgi:signal transduction histidine kinase